MGKEVKAFTHSGHLGDILYSLPAVKILCDGEAIIYIKEIFEDHRGHINGNTGPERKGYNQCDAIKDLLLQQPYIKEVRKFPWNGDYAVEQWPGLYDEIDYDLDKSRRQRRKGYIFHIQRYFDQFGINDQWQNYVPGWITVDDRNDFPFMGDNYAIFQVTDRWHGFAKDWKAIYYDALPKYDNIYFTGYRKEYRLFKNHFGIPIKYKYTGTLLDLARVIKNSRAVYCNQVSALVIAQGLGKKYYLARNADRTHCHTKLENETLI